MAVEGGIVSHYYILVIPKFIYFMSLFRHSVWFSFFVKQFPCRFNLQCKLSFRANTSLSVDDSRLVHISQL